MDNVKLRWNISRSRPSSGFLFGEQNSWFLTLLGIAILYVHQSFSLSCPSGFKTLSCALIHYFCISFLVWVQNFRAKIRDFWNLVVWDGNSQNYVVQLHYLTKSNPGSAEAWSRFSLFGLKNLCTFEEKILKNKQKCSSYIRKPKEGISK